MLCPLLETLHLFYLHPSNAEDVATLITARLKLRLRSVRVTFGGYIGEEYRCRVEEFRDQGLDIEWAYLPAGRQEEPPETGLPTLPTIASLFELQPHYSQTF
ncbi:hypothetical protein L218DRAFT_957341 [Marasmius fiardii PR-910]|nr:hypothetical protein L218DRAFT_957341 [Marasmius fiardii PR-910]